MTHTIKLIVLYYQVCTFYNCYCTENVLRFNQNAHNAQITDEELLTIYFFCTIEEEKGLKNLCRSILSTISNKVISGVGISQVDKR